MDRNVIEVSSLSLSLSRSFSLFLSLSLSLFFSLFLSVSLSFSDYLPTFLLIHLSTYLPIYLSVCLSIYLPVYLQAWKRSYSARLLHFAKLTTSKMQQFCETSSMFELDNIKNEATLRDFLIFRSRQHQKRSNSAKLLQFLNWTTSKTNNSARLLQVANLTTSKTDELCEASFKNGNLSVELTASYQCVLRFFQSTCLRLLRKSDAKSYEVLHLSRKIISLSKAEDPMLQNATRLRKSAPWPPNISDEHDFCTAPATRNASLKILFKCPTPAIAFGNATKPSRFAHFWQGAQSLAPATRKRIWMSKSAPYPSVFCTFDFEMCFAPQRRALFRHLNY